MMRDKNLPNPLLVLVPIKQLLHPLSWRLSKSPWPKRKNQTPELSKAKVMQMLTSPLIWKEKDTVRSVAKVLNVDYRSFENRFRKSEISKARNCLILRNKRRDATKSKEWEPIIIEFFRSEPVSRASPNMKDVFKNRKDGTTTPKRLLQIALIGHIYCSNRSTQNILFSIPCSVGQSQGMSSRLVNSTAVSVSAASMQTYNSS